MSLATAAKEAPGLTPSTAHASTPSSAGRVFSAPDLKSGRRLGPALLQCLGMSRRVASGQGVGRAPHHHSFQGAGIVFQEDRHCPPLSLPADFVSIWRFVGLFVLFFFFDCPQIRKKHERLCPNRGLNPSPKAGCQLAPHVHPRPSFSPALCPAVDYVVFLIRPFSNASVSTSAPLPQPSLFLYLKLLRPNKIVHAVCSSYW